MSLLTTSCYKITPAGFWITFKKDLIVTKESDQGPWGGHREIKWKSKDENTFIFSQILDFATKNDWELTDSTSFPADSLSKLTNNRLVKHEYPLYVSDDYSNNILINYVLPKLERTDLMVYRFKTGWIAVEPGNARDTDRNGFVIVNSNGTEMTVYHLWGE